MKIPHVLTLINGKELLRGMVMNLGNENFLNRRLFRGRSAIWNLPRAACSALKYQLFNKYQKDVCPFITHFN
jgi:hypothetical protein